MDDSSIALIAGLSIAYVMLGVALVAIWLRVAGADGEPLTPTPTVARVLPAVFLWPVVMAFMVVFGFFTLIGEVTLRLAGVESKGDDDGQSRT